MPFVELRKDKPVPIIQAKVGNAHLATYRYTLALPGEEQVILGVANEASLKDHTKLKKVADLNNSRLRWDIRVTNPNTTEKTKVSIVVRIIQGDFVVDEFVRDDEFIDGFYRYYTMVGFGVK